MKQTITIEVDVPDGWEAIEFRMPKEGEKFISDRGFLAEQNEIPCVGPRLIVRRAFVWPSWLKCAAIAKDANGNWWFYSTANVNKDAVHSRWICGDSNTSSLLLNDWAFNIDLPDVPWDQSLRINPAYKGDTK